MSVSTKKLREIGYSEEEISFIRKNINAFTPSFLMSLVNSKIPFDRRILSLTSSELQSKQFFFEESGLFKNSRDTFYRRTTLQYKVDDSFEGIDCPFCHSKGTYRFKKTKQTRSNDEGETIFAFCTSCKTTGRL